MKGSNRALVFGGVALVAVAGLVVGAVAGIGAVVPGRLERLVRRELAASVDAEVDFGAVGVSLFSSFPRLAVTVSDVSVVGRGPFAGVPLATIPRVSVSVNLWSALTGDTLTVRSVTLEDPSFVLRVDADGKANWDVSKGGGGGSSVDLSLDRVTVRDLALDYEDRQGKTAARVAGLSLDGSAAVRGSVSSVDAHATVDALDFRSGRTRWVRDAAAVVDAKVDYDLSSGAITLHETRSTLDRLPLLLTGSVAPAGDDWDLDLSFRAEETPFGAALGMLPRAYTANLDGLDAAGTVAFSGTAKGRYGADGAEWPGFDVSLAVKDARYQYPGLPSPVSDIDVEVAVRHAQGPPEDTRIDLARLGFVVDRAPFGASGTVRRALGDPIVDLVASGHVDLAALQIALPLPEGTSVPRGTLDLDVAFAGAQSDFEAPNPGRLKASGTVRGQGIEWVSSDVPVPVTFERVDVSLSPEAAEIEELRLRYGDSDLAATGRFDNLLGYAMGGAVLGGRVALTSDRLDLRAFQGGGGGAQGAADDGLLVAIPTDLAIDVDADLRKVVTRRTDLEHVKGRLSVKEGALRMEDVRASMLGGSARVSGAYVAPTAGSAEVDLSLDAVQFDLGQTLATVLTLRRIAPLLEGADGKFDTGLSIRTRLGRDGTPDLRILTSAGSIGPSGVRLRSKHLEPSAKKLGGDDFASVNLGGANIAFAVDGGKARLAPFEVSLGPVPASVSGTAGLLERTLDLRFALTLPTRGLDAALLGGLAGANADLVLRVKGGWDDPKVTLGLQGADGDSPVEGVETVAADAARAQADRILAEARRAADALLASADSRATKLVREANGPAEKVAAEAAARLVRTEARKAADRLLATAEAEAKALLGGPAPASGGKSKGGKAGKSR